MGEIFHEAFIRPTINGLLFFYKIFSSLGTPGSLGFAIISLTVFVRLLLHPLFKQQADMARKMQEMKPHLDHLSKKHKDDKKRLQEEQMKLYQQMGVNPASGCLSAIIQMPLFIALYQVILKFVSNGKTLTQVTAEINKEVYFVWLKIKVLDPGFFGINLAKSPQQYFSSSVFFLLIPVITGVLQYYQISLSAPQPKKSVDTGKKKDNDEKKKGNNDDMQTMMSSQMKIMFPLMIGYFSYSLPIGLSLYWNIFSLLSIIQYRKKS